MKRCPLLRIAVDLLPRRILRHRTVCALASQHPLSCRHVLTRASWRFEQPMIRLSTDCSNDDGDDDGDGSGNDRHVRITTHDTSDNRVRIVTNAHARLHSDDAEERALKKRDSRDASRRDADCAVSDATGNFEMCEFRMAKKGVYYSLRISTRCQSLRHFRWILSVLN